MANLGNPNGGNPSGNNPSGSNPSSSAQAFQKWWESNQQFNGKYTQALTNQTQYLKDTLKYTDEQIKKLQKIAHQNDYIAATNREKLQYRQQEQKTLEEQLRVYNLLRESGEKLSESEKEHERALKHQLQQAKTFAQNLEAVNTQAERISEPLVKRLSAEMDQIKSWEAEYQKADKKYLEDKLLLMKQYKVTEEDILKAEEELQHLRDVSVDANGNFSPEEFAIRIANIESQATDATSLKKAQLFKSLAHADDDRRETKHNANKAYGQEQSGFFAGLKRQIGMLGEGEDGKSHFGRGVLALASGTNTGLGKGLTAVSETVGLIKTAFKGNPLGILVTLVEGISSLMGSLVDTLDKGITEYATMQTTYYAKVNTRLDGLAESNNTFDEFASYFSKTFGSTTYLSQKSLLENLSRLVESGIAYDLETRTVLATLSDRMVSTFDILDQTLTRMTRLYGTDMSAAALGSESILTEFLNQNFQDTSYLSDVYDSVNNSLTEAMSQMTQQDAVEFNYAVQKWLGSLYSSGMSSEGVQKLAQGIGYLATGNIEAFNSDDSLRTLFALSTQGSYADLLVNGVNASDIDALLNNIVSYLSTISDDTNQVTKNVKAGIYGGLSLSDIEAAANLTTTQISAITESATTWSDSIDHVNNYLLDFAEQNTSIATQIQNLLDNTILSLGNAMIGSDGDRSSSEYGGVGDILNSTYGQWQLASQFGTLGGIVKSLLVLTELDDLFSTVKNDWYTATSSLSDLVGSAGLLNGSALITTRGETYADRNRTYGTSTSSSLAFTSGLTSSDSLIDTMNAANAVTSEYADTIASEVTAATLASNAEAIEAAATSYTGETTSSTVEISDLYKALFEDGKLIRVSLAQLEDKVTTLMTGSDWVMHTSEANSGEIKDSITNLRTDLSNLSTNAPFNYV